MRQRLRSRPCVLMTRCIARRRLRPPLSAFGFAIVESSAIRGAPVFVRFQTDGRGVSVLGFGMARSRGSDLSARLKAIRHVADDLSRELVRTSRGRLPVTRTMADAISRMATNALKTLAKQGR